jgi:hypothetical protein
MNASLKRKKQAVFTTTTQIAHRKKSSHPRYLYMEIGSKDHIRRIESLIERDLAQLRRSNAMKDGGSSATAAATGAPSSSAASSLAAAAADRRLTRLLDAYEAALAMRAAMRARERAACEKRRLCVAALVLAPTAASPRVYARQPQSTSI